MDAPALKIITIIISDGPEPSRVNADGINRREAAMACWEAFEALAEAAADMTLDNEEMPQ